MSQFISAQATRIDKTHYAVNWVLKTPCDVEVYASNAIDTEHELVGCTDATTLTIECDPNSRLHFYLKTPGSVCPVSERRLSFEGTSNFRDFGGYKGADGRTVKWGRLYRSGKLSALTTYDLELLSNLGIKKVFDFRREEETRLHPTVQALHSQLAIERLTIGKGSARSFSQLIKERGLSEHEILDGVRAIYRDLVVEHVSAYKIIFGHLLTQNQPLLIHCTAGKDRTGIGAALILLALGVSHNDIEQDYLLTAKYYPSPTEQQEMDAIFGKKPELWDTLKLLLSVRPEFIKVLFDVIEKEFGSYQNYFTELFDLDNNSLEKLRQTWLY